ncbi:MAG: TonB-dependent receptor [Acidobacteria bacterium]|nr:TonB-dependent receptor [Acidobacteriota bacterium]
MKHLLILLLAAPGLFAQAHRAIILGQVTDSTGAIVAGAEVRVVQKSTNVIRTTRSNEAGGYEVPGLLPDIYRVEATQPGFKGAVVDEINVTSGRRVEINLTMTIGEVKEAVTVRAEGQILDTVSADVNTGFDTRKIADLPIGQGHATYLFLMAPGSDSASSAGRGGSGMDVQPLQRAGTSTTRFNGSPAGTTEYTLDGTPNTQRGNASAGGGVSFSPSAEMVREVRVQTATFDASVGHTGGATVDVVLRSGTNELHGSALGFVRAPEWNANTWSGNRGGVPRQDFTYRRWGFTAGGPVLIPKIYNGKDKTFFYYGYERWSSLSPNPPVFATVPRPQHLNGDMSDLLALGAQFQIYDPDSARSAPNNRIQRAPFANNIIPATRINPIAKSISKFFPEPNTAGTRDGTLNYTYNAGPLPRTYWASTLRLDHNLSRSHKLFGRFVLAQTGIPSNSLYGRTDISNLTFDGRNRDVAISDVWTASPSLIGEFRAAISRFHWDTAPLGVEVPYSDLGLASVGQFIDTSRVGMPSVAITGYPQSQGAGATALTTSAGARQVSDIRTGAANFTHIRGKHSFKFGADARWYLENRGSEDLLRITFSGAYSNGPLDTAAAPPIGAGLSDFLLGRFASAQISQPSKAANLSTYQGFYLQDDWRVSPRLTLNLGMRYEREGAPTERFNQAIAGFDFNATSPIAAASGLPLKGGLLFAGVNGNPRTIYRSDLNNFAPRIGLAYQARKNTVVRAGYGLYYIPYGQRFFANEGGVPGFDVNTVSLSTADNGLTFSRTLDNMFPVGLDKPVGSSQGLATFLGQGLSLRPFGDNPTGYNQRWQFSIQHRLGDNYRLEARYVGNRTVKMPINRNFNALPNSYLSRSPERDQPVIDNLNALVNNPLFGIAGVGGTIGAQRTIARQQLLRPFPQYGNITGFVHQGWSSYHALQVEFERRMSSGLTFQTSYTFSKTLDGLEYLNEGDSGPERVISAADRPHIWRFLSIYELPFGRGKKYGGWQVQGVAFLENGATLAWGNIIFRGNIKDIPVDKQIPERMFNVDAGFERAAARQPQFNLRTFPSRLSGVRASSQTNTDFSLIKNTTFKERFNIQFRAEAYNVFNQHFFIGGGTVPTNAAFGVTTSAASPRTVQLGVRLVY